MERKFSVGVITIGLLVITCNVGKIMSHALMKAKWKSQESSNCAVIHRNTTTDATCGCVSMI